jgi:type IV secretory pathway VirB2 component (pilin)
MPSTIFQGLSASLFKGDSSPLSILSNEPAFSDMLVASVASAASSAAKFLLSSLAFDLTDGEDLTQLTSAMVLTNLFDMLKLGNSKTYAIIRVIGPCFILVTGAYQFSQRVAFIPVIAKAAISSLAHRITASIVVGVPRR